MKKFAVSIVLVKEDEIKINIQNMLLSIDFVNSKEDAISEATRIAGQHFPKHSVFLTTAMEVL